MNAKYFRLIIGLAVLILAVVMGLVGRMDILFILLFFAVVLVSGFLFISMTDCLALKFHTIGMLINNESEKEQPRMNVKPPIIHYALVALCLVVSCVLYLSQLWVYFGGAITVCIILYVNAEIENLRRATKCLFDNLKKNIDTTEK